MNTVTAGLLGAAVGAALGGGATYGALRMKPTRALPAGATALVKGHRYTVTVTSENPIPMIGSVDPAKIQQAADSSFGAGMVKLVSFTPSSDGTSVSVTFDVLNTPQVGAGEVASLGGVCAALVDEGPTP